MYACLCTYVLVIIHSIAADFPRSLFTPYINEMALEDIFVNILCFPRQFTRNVSNDYGVL